LKTCIEITQQYNTTEHFLQQFASNQFRDEVILLKGARMFGFEKIAALLQSKVHQTVMEINLTAIAFNLKNFSNCLHPA